MTGLSVCGFIYQHLHSFSKGTPDGKGIGTVDFLYKKLDLKPPSLVTAYLFNNFG